MAELRFEKGFLKGKTIQIPAGRYLIVGRAKEAGLPLPDPQLSRRHCKLTHTVDGIMLEDLGSRNGTYVNGQAITTVKLRHGDQIVFGDQTAHYDHPKGLMDSSGDFESEEAEATREIPELQPGQAMLLNPPKIVRGPDSAPPPKPPSEVGSPPMIEAGLLPPSQALEQELDTELPQIDGKMPAPSGLEEVIEADLSAPLPELPPNPISMEETMVRPQQPRTDPAKAPPPKSKIKKLMESYKAEVMATTKDDVKPVPKAKPAASLKPAGEESGSQAGVAAGHDSDRAQATAEAPTLRPVTAPDPRRRSTGLQTPTSGAGVGGKTTAEPAVENEAQIEQVLEAADREMRPGAASEARPAPHPKTIPMRRDPTAEELAQAAKRASALADSFAEDLLNRELGEAAEVIADEPAAQAGPFQASETTPTLKRELKADETGEIDPTAIQGANGEIDIDTSRIDRHREIADEIFRAAQGEEAEEEAAEQAAGADEVIEEVDEDFDLDSLEQVAAPTLDLGKLDKLEAPAGSGTSMEAIKEPVKPTPLPAAVSNLNRNLASGRKITPPPSLPPILVEEHLEQLGENEDYSSCAGLWEAPKPRQASSETNLLEPILAKNEEYQRLSD